MGALCPYFAGSDGILHRGQLLASGPTDHLMRQYGDERYRFWTKDPHRANLTFLEGLQPRVSDHVDTDGWSAVEIDVPDGPTQAAHLLEQLVGAGVAVSRFERIGLVIVEFH